MSLFRTGYVTEHVPLKASLASSAVLIERACSVLAPTCSILENVHQSVKVLLVLMLIDLVTGVMASHREGKRIESRRFGCGAKRKFTMLLVVWAASLLDGVFGTGSAIFIGSTWWFIGTETISLYENAERIGVWMPSGLKVLMTKLLQRANRSLETLVSEPGVVLPPSATADTAPPEKKEE